MATATIGTVSEGTLRTEDLLEAFANELERLDTAGEYASLVSDARADIEDMVNADYDPDVDVSDLMDTLGVFAPPYCYFGTLEGDGAHFGFWPDRETLEADDRVRPTYDPNDWTPGDYVYCDDDNTLRLTATGEVIWVAEG